MFTHLNDIRQLLGTMDLYRNHMNALFGNGNSTSATGYGWPGTETYPRTNLNDTGDTLEIFAEVPGVSKEDLQVKIQGNYLQISGTRTTGAPEGFKTHRNERSSGTFSRSFTLPYDVEASKVEATLKEGMLKLVLPKAETAKPRQITIQ